MRLSPLVGLLTVGVFQPARAATFTATTCSRGDVGTAVIAALASPDGENTVTVPAGQCTWNSSLVLTRGITLKGAGIGQTVITSAVSPAFGASIVHYAVTNPSANEPLRITGFTFDGNWNSGCVYLVRNSFTNSTYTTKARIDSNRFTRCGNTSYPGRAIQVDGLTFGVIDHNIFVDNQKTFDDEESDNYGWAIAPDIGGPHSMYFEDNDVTNSDSRCSLITSGGQGGRYVIRHNTFNTVGSMASGQHFDIHGTLSDRGTVTAEIYRNTLTTRAGAYQFLDHRGGTAMVFQNRTIKASGDIEMQLREEDTGTYPLLDQVTNSFYWSNGYGVSTGQEQPITPFVAQGAPYVQLNRDYFTPSVGLEAAKPAACNDGTYFAATDTDQLYRCHPANTWSLLYRPYTYPHPLASGAPPDQLSPSRPTGLQVL